MVLSLKSKGHRAFIVNKHIQRTSIASWLIAAFCGVKVVLRSASNFLTTLCKLLFTQQNLLSNGCQ